MDRSALGRLPIPFVLAVLCAAVPARAQTVGPNDPAAATNDVAIGNNPWSDPGNTFTSDDSYATVAARGISNYLRASDFQFNLSGPGVIGGIQLDVERSTFAPQDVAVLDNWTSGLTKAISAGTDRCLIVVYAQENGINSRDITAMTYGGRAMTQVVERIAGVADGFNARLEAWMLLDADIALAGSTAIVPTYGAHTPLEYCEAFSAVVFQFVDQIVPVISPVTAGAQGTANPHQLGAAVTTPAGSIAVNVATCGNNTVPAIANGGTNTYTINSGFTEGTDVYFANVTVAPNTGACLQTAHKLIAADGTEQPGCTFNGTVNRYALIGFAVQRAHEYDQSVQLMQGGVPGGSDLALAQAWPTTDSYVTYGGPGNIWGRSWTFADINDPGFGAAFSTLVQNGTARVDHMRITVYINQPQPIELLGFSGQQQDQVVRLEWSTATEQENDHFVVQHSLDANDFTDIGTVPGAGSSNATLSYSLHHEHPVTGINYYRLKQVDTNGASEVFQTIAVPVTHGGLVVFPNPTPDGTVTVHDPGIAIGDVAVYDHEMRLVRTHYVNGADPVVHLGDLPDGTYVLVVRSEQGVHTSRVLKASRER